MTFIVRYVCTYSCQPTGSQLFPAFGVWYNHCKWVTTILLSKIIEEFLQLFGSLSFRIETDFSTERIFVVYFKSKEINTNTHIEDRI